MTNIDYEGGHSTLIESDEDVVVYKLNDDGIGWELVGRMKTYGPVCYGSGMNLIPLKSGEEGIHTSPIGEAIRKSNGVEVRTANSVYSLEYIERPSARSVSDWSPMAIAKSIGKLIQDATRY